MRATIVLAGCFLISSSVFASDSQPNSNGSTMKPIVVALAATPAHKVVAARVATKALVTAETPMAEGSLEKFGATGLPQ
jgi:hypothetical protein